MIDLITTLVGVFGILNVIFLFIFKQAQGFNFDDPKKHFLRVIVHEYIYFMMVFILLCIFHLYLRF